MRHREKAEGVPIHSFVETSERPGQNIQSHKGPLQEVRGVGTCQIFSISPGAPSPLRSYLSATLTGQERKGMHWVRLLSSGEKEQ